MLSAEKLKKLSTDKKVTTEQLAGQIVRGGLDKRKAVSAVRNWKKGLEVPIPRKADVENLAAVLGVAVSQVSQWRSCYRYAPGSPRKAGLIRNLIVGRDVQDAMDILKFTRKRAAAMVNKVLKSAIADAEEQQANVDNLYISDVRIDDAGIRMGTKRFRAKDRGRAHSISKKACHITVIITEEAAAVRQVKAAAAE
jgi:large subunit ribosomal protein L22